MDDAQWRRDVDKRLHKLETDGAVDAERYSSIIGRLDKIEGILSKLMWLIVVTIIAGVLRFVMAGGLNTSPV